MAWLTMVNALDKAQGTLKGLKRLHTLYSGRHYNSTTYTVQGLRSHWNTEKNKENAAINICDIELEVRNKRHVLPGEPLPTRRW